MHPATEAAFLDELEKIAEAGGLDKAALASLAPKVTGLLGKATTRLGKMFGGAGSAAEKVAPKLTETAQKVAPKLTETAEKVTTKLAPTKAPQVTQAVEKATTRAAEGVEKGTRRLAETAGRTGERLTGAGEKLTERAGKAMQDLTPATAARAGTRPATRGATQAARPGTTAGAADRAAAARQQKFTPEAQKLREARREARGAPVYGAPLPAGAKVDPKLQAKWQAFKTKSQLRSFQGGAPPAHYPYQRTAAKQTRRAQEARQALREQPLGNRGWAPRGKADVAKAKGMGPGKAALIGIPALGAGYVGGKAMAEGPPAGYGYQRGARPYAYQR